MRTDFADYKNILKKFLINVISQIKVRSHIEERFKLQQITATKV